MGVGSVAGLSSHNSFSCVQLTRFRIDGLFPDHPLYEVLLIGEQVDVHSTVYDGLLIVEQVDVQTSVCTRACSRASRPMSTLTGPLSTVGLIPWNVPALQLLPACGWHDQALQQLLKEEENKEDEEGGKSGKEDKREISYTHPTR